MQIDVCFLNILNCERALDAIASKYVNGDSSVGAAGFFLLEGIRGIHPTSRKNFPTNKVVKTESNCNTHSQMFYQYDSYPVTQKLYFLDLNFSNDFESKKNKI